MTAAEKLLRELIALPSVNPASMPEGDPRAGESRVADFLAATAAQAGLDVELRPVFPGRPNLLARLASSSASKRRIVLAPHSDTVGEAAMPDSLFQPILRGDRLYGCGACDTKGSVAAMLTALGRVAREGIRPAQTEIVLAVTMDEEGNQAGSRALAASGFKADLAIVGEPTCLRVITAHKGAAWLRLVTRGRAAHGSKPELGRNAIHEMAKVVDTLETVYARRLRQRLHPVLGAATVNVGVIRGGKQPNIVPALCAIEVDRRTLPGESNATVRREVKRLLRERGLRAEICNAKHGLICPPLETNHRKPLVRNLMEMVGQSEPAGVDYFSDAAILARGGIPTVLFGPGSIAQAHTAEEWIGLRSLDRAARLLEQFLRSLP